MSPAQQFAGRRILVTGASSGIGRATALAFAARGAETIATGRVAEELAALSAEARKGKLHSVQGDLTDPRFVEVLADEAGALDILVNCAGVVKHAPFLASDPADWARVFETNVIALLRLTQRVARDMRECGGGHIINVSSVLARQVYPFTLAYAASKHAVRAISDGLRLELQDHNIKVTEIAPGLTETNIFRDVDHPAVTRAYAERSHPRLRPEEVARAILYAAAASPEACPVVVAINPVGQSGT